MEIQFKKIILFVMISLFPFVMNGKRVISSGVDYILLTNGEQIFCKVNKVSKSEVDIVRIEPKGFIGSKKEPMTLDASKIYMIKYEDRGNQYFLLDGSRKSGEKQKIDKSADLIYLIDGAEIPAWDIVIDSDRITYKTSKDKKKAKSFEAGVALDSVFMILYSDGSCDIINDLEAIKAKKEEKVKEDSALEAKIKVIFHTVKTGETLTSIAKEYDVEVNLLRSWNDLDAKIKDNSRLKAGLQLIIQKEIKE
jgi:LysM domain protein